MSSYNVADTQEKKCRLELQHSYCVKNKLIMFAPFDGLCYFCGKPILETDKNLITGCNHCDRSFVE